MDGAGRRRTTILLKRSFYGLAWTATDFPGVVCDDARGNRTRSIVRLSPARSLRSSVILKLAAPEQRQMSIKTQRHRDPLAAVLQVCNLRCVLCTITALGLADDNSERLYATIS